MEESQGPDSRIAQRKNGKTHLAYEAEHAVDLKTEMILAAEIYPANAGDRQTLEDTVLKAQVNLQQAKSDSEIRDVVADKGYYSAAMHETFAEPTPCRTYIPERNLPVGRR
ncbi:MAG: transposase, partial [Planctomycetaceae bacterium]